MVLLIILNKGKIKQFKKKNLINTKDKIMNCIIIIAFIKVIPSSKHVF